MPVGFGRLLRHSAVASHRSIPIRSEPARSTSAILRVLPEALQRWGSLETFRQPPEISIVGTFSVPGPVGTLSVPEGIGVFRYIQCTWSQLHSMYLRNVFVFARADGYRQPCFCLWAARAARRISSSLFYYLGSHSRRRLPGRGHRRRRTGNSARSDWAAGARHCRRARAP